MIGVRYPFCWASTSSSWLVICLQRTSKSCVRHDFSRRSVKPFDLRADTFFVKRCTRHRLFDDILAVMRFHRRPAPAHQLPSITRREIRTWSVKALSSTFFFFFFSAARSGFASALSFEPRSFMSRSLEQLGVIPRCTCPDDGLGINDQVMSKSAFRSSLDPSRMRAQTP